MGKAEVRVVVVPRMVTVALLLLVSIGITLLIQFLSGRAYVHDRPVQFAGFKVFYKNDKPMMTPAQVLKLWPAPVYVQYQ